MGTQAAPIISTVGQQVRLLEARPFRPFKTSEEYLYAMKEDLAEWLHSLYLVDINVDNFMEQLETGVLLCQHANRVHRLASDEGQGHLVGHVVYRHTVVPGTFPARDNVSNFIKWCRQLGIYECLLFETEDLVTRKNEKSFILCLLEVARRGAKLGMPAPLLVQMEQEIDRDIERDKAGSGGSGHLSLAEMRSGPQEVPDGDRPQIIRNDLKSLDEMVRDLVNRCVCPEQFLMVREAEGKYRIGETKMLIYVRILRSHVMVRVGGGWDTLEHFLDKHDPCRCRQVHRPITASRVTIKHGQNGPGQTQMQVTYERSPLAATVQSAQNRQQSLSPMSGSPPRMRKASSSSNSSNQPSSSGSQTSLNAEKVLCPEDTTLANHDSELQHSHRPRLTVTTPPEDKDLHTDGHRTARGTKPAGSPKMENGRRSDQSPRRCKAQHVGCSPNGVPCQCTNGNLPKKPLGSSAPRSPSMDNLSKQQHGVSSPLMSRRSRRLSQDHGHNSSMSAASSATRSQRPVLNRSLSSGTTELCSFTRDGAGRFSARERRVSSSPTSSVATAVPSGRSTWNSSCNAQVPRSRPSLRPDTYRLPAQSQSHSGSYNCSPTKTHLSTAQMLAEQIREKNLTRKEFEELIRKLEEERAVLVRRDRDRDQAGYLNKTDASRTASPSNRSTVIRSSPATVVTVTSSPVGPIADGQCYTKQWLANNANNGQRKRRSSLASPSSPDSGSDLGCEASPMAPCGSASGCEEPDGPEGQGEDSNMSSESSSSVVIRVSPRKDLQPEASASKIPVPLFY